MKRIHLVGVGGQGIITMSRLVGSAVMKAGFDVMTSEVHGLSQRGGTVASNIKVGPNVHSSSLGHGEADILVGLEPVEAARHINYLKRNGDVLVSTTRIQPYVVSREGSGYPSNSILRDILRERASRLWELSSRSLVEKLGETRVENVVMVGALSSLLDEIPESAFTEAITEAFTGKLEEINVDAFHGGRGLTQPGRPTHS
jgi:indolepyruvate ferredoxin oxidoreductase beta subunit